MVDRLKKPFTHLWLATLLCVLVMFSAGCDLETSGEPAFETVITSCDFIADQSYCDEAPAYVLGLESAREACEDPPLELQSGTFNESPCPISHLVGKCRPFGADNTFYFYATGSQAYDTSAAEVECDAIPGDFTF